ncbi:hypothetical protein V6N13_037762 [Hibiscus sabdariffa]
MINDILGLEVGNICHLIKVMEVGIIFSNAKTTLTEVKHKQSIGVITSKTSLDSSQCKTPINVGRSKTLDSSEDLMKVYMGKYANGGDDINNKKENRSIEEIEITGRRFNVYEGLVDQLKEKQVGIGPNGVDKVDKGSIEENLEVRMDKHDNKSNLVRSKSLKGLNFMGFKSHELAQDDIVDSATDEDLNSPFSLISLGGETWVAKVDRLNNEGIDVIGNTRTSGVSSNLGDESDENSGSMLKGSTRGYCDVSVKLRGVEMTLKK